MAKRGRPRKLEPSEKKKVFLVGMDAPTHARLKALAKSTRRSMRKQISFMLKDYPDA